MFVYSIVPKVQETQWADRRKKEEKKIKRKEKPGIERADIRRSGLVNMHLDKSPDQGPCVSHSLPGAISQDPCPSPEHNAAQKWAFLAVSAFGKEKANV